jgi:hypothetical protein
MTYEFQLEESDFLTQQLYRMSKLPKTRKDKVYGWIGTPILFAAVALFFWRSNNQPLTYYFIVLAIAAIAFYPAYHLWRYKRHCAKHVHNNVREMSDLRMSLTFGKDQFVMAGKTGESKINYSELKQVDELGTHFLLQLKNGQAVIVPKRELNDQPEFTTELHQIAADRQIYWNSETDWAWK